MADRPTAPNLGLSQATADTLYQPLDADLTSIAGLSTTSYGRACLVLADEAAARTAWGLVIGTNVQAHDAGLASLVSADASAGLPYVSAANVWTSLSLAADKGIYATGTGALATYDLSAFARTLLDDADAAAMQTTLGITSAAMTLDFGDGSDGAAVFNGTDEVTGFTRSGATYTASTEQEFQWTNCTISDAVIVNPAGCPLFVSGTLTMNGTCSISSGGGNAANEVAGPASSAQANARFYYGVAGGNGRTSAGAGSASSGLQSNARSMGGNGGAGGTSTSNGGAGTALTQWSAAYGSLRRMHSAWQMQVMPVTFAALQGGGGGGGGGVSTLVAATGYSGGGGGGGGIVMIRARNLVGSATTSIKANGGNGANAAITGTTGGGGGGGAGGGGFVSCSFDTITGAVVFSANAGTAGNASSVGAQAANGGAGGNGGRVWVAYRTKSTAISLSAALSNGGAAGAGGGSAGANGTIGTTVECDL